MWDPKPSYINQDMFVPEDWYKDSNIIESGWVDHHKGWRCTRSKVIYMRGAIERLCVSGNYRSEWSHSVLKRYLKRIKYTELNPSNHIKRMIKLIDGNQEFWGHIGGYRSPQFSVFDYAARLVDNGKNGRCCFMWEGNLIRSEEHKDWPRTNLLLCQVCNKLKDENEVLSRAFETDYVRSLEGYREWGLYTKLWVDDIYKGRTSVKFCNDCTHNFQRRLNEIDKATRLLKKISKLIYKRNGGQLCQRGLQRQNQQASLAIPTTYSKP